MGDVAASREINQTLASSTGLKKNPPVWRSLTARQPGSSSPPQRPQRANTTITIADWCSLCYIRPQEGMSLPPRAARLGRR